MTQEEKQLLLKDLCARLPYGALVFIRKPFGCVMSEEEEEELTTDILQEFIENDDMLMRVLPYLRPMSSMTEEEREEVQVFICDEWFFEDSGFATKVRKEGYIEFLANYDCSGIDPEFCGEYADWLTAHHFDYRGLIEKGLALEAPEGMYKTE